MLEIAKVHDLCDLLIEIICPHVVESELHNITHECKGFISRDLTHLNRKEASSGVVNGHFGSIHFHSHYLYSIMPLF